MGNARERLDKEDSRRLERAMVRREDAEDGDKEVDNTCGASVRSYFRGSWKVTHRSNHR